MRAWSHKLGGHRKEAPKSPKLSVQPCEPPILSPVSLPSSCRSVFSHPPVILCSVWRQNKKEDTKETREERDEMGRQEEGECTWQGQTLMKDRDMDRGRQTASGSRLRRTEWWGRGRGRGGEPREEADPKAGILRVRSQGRDT